jgi:hypothetical protein
VTFIKQKYSGCEADSNVIWMAIENARINGSTGENEQKKAKSSDDCIAKCANLKVYKINLYKS